MDNNQSNYNRENNNSKLLFIKNGHKQCFESCAQINNSKPNPNNTILI